MASQLIAAPDHSLFDFICGFSFEGSTSVKHLVEKHSKSPYINFVVVFRLEEHLWGHILVGSAESGPFCFHLLRTPAKIAYFDISNRIQKEVLGLNVWVGTLMSL